jgi:hypothetical protein
MTLKNKIIAILVIIIAVYIPSGVSVAEAPAPAQEDLTKEELVELAYSYANKYGVSGDYMVDLISCENRPWDPELQSQIKYNFNSPNRGIVKGEQEQSYGLSMIHLPDHPSVTKEQATDPYYALNFMAEHLANGQNIWSCKNII